jgi:hypothetical protein
MTPRQLDLTFDLADRFPALFAVPFEYTTSSDKQVARGRTRRERSLASTTTNDEHDPQLLMLDRNLTRSGRL